VGGDLVAFDSQPKVFPESSTESSSLRLRVALRKKKMFISHQFTAAAAAAAARESAHI